MDEAIGVRRSPTTSGPIGLRSVHSRLIIGWSGIGDAGFDEDDQQAMVRPSSLSE